MKAAKPRAHWWGSLGLAVTFLGGAARAEPTLIEPASQTSASGAPASAEVLPVYLVGLESRIAYARRSDFRYPVFLFQQSVEEIIARELRTELDFRFRLFPALYAQFIVPYSWRQADVRFAPVSISSDQVLSARWLDLENHGIADASVGLVLRAYASRVFAAQLHAGVMLARDDNPGSNTVPKRLPLSTGQTELYLEPLFGLSLEALSLGARYRLGLHPGNTATYLIRKIDVQSYAAGALGPFLTHEFELRAELGWQRLRFRLSPELSIAENPLIMEQGQPLQFIDPLLRYDVALEGRVGVVLGEPGALSFFYKHWFLEAWQMDPFFPIQIPDQGFGIAWEVEGF